MHGRVFGFFPEWKWRGYLLVDGWTYRTNRSRLLFLKGYEVLCHTRACDVIARILRENAAMLDTLRETYRIGNYARTSATFEALEWLLGVTFTPHEATVNPFARLIIFEREQPKVVPQPEVQRERARPPLPPLSAKSSWVRIACVDDSEQPRPVPGVALEVVTASAEVRTAYTGQDGVAHLDGIAPGRVNIRVLGRDGRTWRPLEGDAATPCSADERFTWHQVLRGECLSRIARRYGINDWRDIWSFRKNEALRKQRRSPHMLHPGDMLAVPALQLYGISRQTEQTHRIEVERGQTRRGYVLASHELRFHAHSGVLLAQYTPEGQTEVRSDAPALDALATTLLHAEENPARSLLLVGHSDAAETPEDDRKLSEARAEGVRHMLRGDRDAWVALAREHCCSEDLPAILRWCAETRGWPCAPAEDGSADTESALRAFQEAYNQSHDASIAEDGALGPETWGAIFDVYQHELANRLETDAAGLEQRQRKLRFCEAAESYGCGSALSIHARTGGEVASFQRTDVQFFEPGDEPLAAKPLLGTYRQVESNLKQGRKLTRNVKSRKSLQKLINTATSAAEAVYEAPFPKALVASQRLGDAYERNLGKLDAGAVLVLEVINLHLALQDATEERSDASTLEATLSVAGATADLGVALLEAYELMLQAGKGTTKSVLGIISGVCDFAAFIAATGRATSAHDYNQAVGQGVAALGAASLTVGSALALVGSWGASTAAAVAATAAGTAVSGGVAGATGAAAAGGSLVSLGPLLLAGGAIAVGVGAAIATLATDNAYQQFAKFCFLGDDYGSAEPTRLAWSPVELPARNLDRSPKITNEATALITLLSGFELEFTGKSLVLYPRFHRAGDVFEIYVEIHPINYAKNACVLEVNLDTEQVTQLRGLRPLRDTTKFFKNAAGRVTQIEIDLREAEPPSFPAVVQYYGGLARARLRFRYGEETRFVPPTPPTTRPVQLRQPWVQISTTHGKLEATLASTWRGSSADESLHVDGPKQPVQPGMNELHD